MAGISNRSAPLLAAVAAAASALAVSTPPLHAAGADGKVVIARGEPVQIAVVLDESLFVGVLLEPGIRNAIEMAVEQHPTIRGYPVQLNDSFDAPCFSDNAVAANAEIATAVISNPQNVAVIGHICSHAFAGVTPPVDGVCSTPPPGTALAIYQSAGIVTINGSTTNPCVPRAGPTVFNSTAVPDPGFDAWYAQVETSPSDLLWQSDYAAEFGTAPTEFADLYFDATILLLGRLQNVSQIVDQQLVIDRAALARAVRDTTKFQGATCSVSLDPATGYRINDPAALARCAD